MNAVETAVKKTLARYKTILTITNVRVKIPKGIANMRWVLAHSFQSENGLIHVDDHWQNGVVVNPKPNYEFLNRHFFFGKGDRGKTVRATVEVVEKTKDGKTTILINYRPCEPAPGDCVFDIKIMENIEGGIRIPRTNRSIQFSSR